MNIWREDNRVFVNEDVRGSDMPKEIILSQAPQLTNELADIHNGYENTAKKYPRKRYSMHCHLKSTYFLIILVLVQEAFFLICRRSRGKYYTALRVMSVFGWIAVGTFLFRVYL